MGLERERPRLIEFLGRIDGTRRSRRNGSFTEIYFEEEMWIDEKEIFDLLCHGEETSRVIAP